MRTGIVLDKLELITLSSGGRIELALGGKMMENEVLVLVGPPNSRIGRPRSVPEPQSKAQAEKLERKRKRQRKWVAAKRADQPSAGLLTTEQVADRLGLGGKLVGHAATSGKLRVAKKLKSKCPSGYTLRFSWPDVVKWRAGVQPRKKAR